MTTRLEQVGTLLQKESSNPRSPLAIYNRATIHQLYEILPEPGSLLALDTETIGLDPTAPEFDVVGIGLAWRDGCVYIDTKEMQFYDRLLLTEQLSKYKLIAHNVAYDAAAMEVSCKADAVDLQWTYCTYGLWRQIASEGYPGQRWGLKDAMTQLLGWPEQNDVKLNDWLVANGWTTKTNKHKANKADLWRAPAEILAEYCSLDADACWQLYHLFDRQVLSLPEFSGLRTYHTDIFMPNVQLVVEQQLRGLRVNESKLKFYRTRLERNILAKEMEFIKHDEVTPHILSYNKAELEALIQLEPNKMTKTGNIAKAWTRWSERIEKASSTNHFNINSKQQLEWLFFDRMGYEPVKTTDTGRRCVDKKSLPFLGSSGKILIEYNKLLKELGYINACLDSLRDSILHPRMKVPGTLTLRQAGGG